jgi:hypothetical protein
MIDSKKLQYFTMSQRLRGYAEGLDEYKNEALINMLMSASFLLEEAWDEYAIANGYAEVKKPLYVPVMEKTK